MGNSCLYQPSGIDNIAPVIGSLVEKKIMSNNSTKKFSAMQFLTDNAPLIVMLFPMWVVGVTTFSFAKTAKMPNWLAFIFAALAAIAVELTGISSFRTLTGVYQSFKHNHEDKFVKGEFVSLVVGVAFYLIALGVSSVALDKQYPGTWALGAVAAILGIAIYIVRAVGETYYKIADEVEQDKAFEQSKREQLLEQEIKDREHSRLLKTKTANIRVYETRTELEQAKHGMEPVRVAQPKQPKRQRRTTPNRPERKNGTTQTPVPNVLQQQTEHNKLSKLERMEQLLPVFANHPTIGQNEAGRTVGIPPGTTSDYVKKLILNGRLVNNGEKGKNQWVVTGKV